MFAALIFSLDLSYKQSVQDLFNIRKKEMELGEHRLQGAQTLQAGEDEQCEQGASPPSVVKISCGYPVYSEVFLALCDALWCMGFMGKKNFNGNEDIITFSAILLNFMWKMMTS